MADNSPEVRAMVEREQEVAGVREYGSRAEAEHACAYLVAHGVEAWIVSDDCGATDPALTFARGARVVVDAADAERADLLLRGTGR